MKTLLLKKLSVGLIAILLFNCVVMVNAQTILRDEVFEQIEMISQTGEKIVETDVSVHFGNDSMEIRASKTSAVLKTFKYTDIKNAEYSYSKNPRWKTGLGLGAAAVVFPPILLVAIPLGFTKHRRHWVTMRTEKDYAVLKVSKSLRKIFIPSFETHSSVKVEALGESK